MDGWQGRERFSVLLDTPEPFPALWASWRSDPNQSARLDVVMLSPGPLEAEVLNRACAAEGLEMPAHWPPATADFHCIALDSGRVHLLLATGDPRRVWREVVARIDAFRFDAPVIDPQGLSKALVRLAAPHATVTARHDSPALRDNLRARGFELAADGHQPMACYRPAFVPSRAPVRRAVAASDARHVVIVGAGLAGAATALALAEQGWHSTVIEGHHAPAQAASGNPAGLFHGIVNAHDGPHARFNRAASWAACRTVQRAIDAHGVAGSTAGLLRLENAGTDPAAMASLLHRLGLPADYVRALDATAASAVCGIALHQPAWFYPHGGWVNPAGLVRAMLAEAGGLCEFLAGRQVHRIVHEGSRWQVLGLADHMIAETDVLVLANAGDALRLLDHPAWPVQAVRGQLTMAPRPADMVLPAVPIAGGGYVMPDVAGQMVFGATAQPGDADACVRAADHAHNLAQLARLLGRAWEGSPAALRGRTAWRCVAEDRLPLIGQVPDVSPDRLTVEQARFVPRRQGLFVFTALGSRGITWSALGGQVLAAAIAGAPSPLPANLLDAVDPARFITRAARRASASN
jgi:tRNA 5-methylaminomethyl-2-thiouridine biosynthesis bifunctional protein